MDRAHESIEFLIDAMGKYRDLPWVVGFSGGKDSTATLHLVVEALRSLDSDKRPRDVYVVYADTLLEHPALRSSALSILRSLGEYSERSLGGVVKPVVLRPGDGEDFLSMMIVRGYPAPWFRFRWCMERLKIRPFKRFAKGLGRYVLVSGVRLSESSERSRNIRSNYGSRKIVDGDLVVVMPLLDWGVEDVLELLSRARRWDGRDYKYLLDIYGVEVDGDCGCKLFTDVRFGCWVCTVVRVDKMPSPEALRRARERLIEISRDPRYREPREGGYGKLNRDGRAEVARVFIEAFKSEPEAFGYTKEEIKGILKKAGLEELESELA